MALSNLDHLSEGSYFSLLYDMIKQRENPWLYAGTGYERIHNGGGDGNPTFGYGFNLAAFSASVVEQVIEHAYNGSMTSQQGDGLDLILDWKTGTSVYVSGQYVTLTRENIINMSDVSLNGAPSAFGSISQRAAIQSLSLTDAEATRMLDVMIKGELNLVHIEGPSGSFGYEDGLDFRLASEGTPAYSTERAALLSVYYNAPVLIGPGVQNAILTDDRPQLWYEIRYNHNHTNHNGLQSRRAEEADLVGVVSRTAKDNPSANIDEYASALDTLYNGYDRLGRRILSRIEDRDGLDNFESAIAPELQVLLDYFVLQPLGASSAPTIDYVQVAVQGVSEQIDAGSFAAAGVSNGKTDANTVNLILGGDGNDLINGLGGADYLYGGDGNDTIYGDGGTTSAANAGHDLINGGNGDDYLNGGDGDEYIVGGAGDDVIVGGAGFDKLVGLNGADSLDGGAGVDTLLGGDGDDSLSGGDDNDFLRGDDGRDTLIGGEGDDRLFGRDGNDRIFGGGGNDALFGNANADILYGEGGDDAFRGLGGNDRMYGGVGDDSLLGNTGRDIIHGNENNDIIDAGEADDQLFGDSGDDTLFGRDGNDLLDGGDGNDLLTGNLGLDTLIGGLGDDTVVGNGGNDVFVFSVGDGNDTFNAFTGGQGIRDVIQLSGFGAAFDTFAEIFDAATDDGFGNTTIDFGGGDSITLIGDSKADLNADDFMFL